MSTEAKTLQDLQPGDEDAYHKKNGWRVGSGNWDYSRIDLLTEELKEKIVSEVRKRRLVQFLSKESWDAFAIETLEEVYAILQKAKAAKEAE